MSRAAYVGIDLAFAKMKSLPVCIVTREGTAVRPVALRAPGLPTPPRGSGNAAALDATIVAAFAESTADYLRAVAGALDLDLRRIAIDAPRAPRGAGQPRRAAEMAMDAARISCFTTPSAEQFESIRARGRAHLAAGGAQSRMPAANQLWMLVGFALFERLGREWECLEVFPQAIARALGAGGVHKSAAGGWALQLAALSTHTGWPVAEESDAFANIAFGPAHDRLDAYMSAWVAALEEHERVAHGQPPEDVIWVPRLGGTVGDAS